MLTGTIFSGASRQQPGATTAPATAPAAAGGQAGATAALAGTVLSGASRVYGGMRQGAAMDAAAGDLNMEGGQAIAQGIQGAEAARLRGRYVASNARGLTAASGLTTTGTSAVANEGQIRGQSEYDALSAIYSGESKAQDLAFRAANLRSEGNAQRIGGWMSGISTMAAAYGQRKPGWMSGISTIFSGGSTWYSKYGTGATPAEYG